MAYEKIHMENLLKEKDELELEIAQLKTDVIDYCRTLEECKKENARLRESLELFRSCMGDGGDLEHAADLLRTATNDHGINQTYDNNPYAVSDQLEAMGTFLGSDDLGLENVKLKEELKNLYLLLDAEGHLGKDGWKRLEEIKKAIEIGKHE